MFDDMTCKNCLYFYPDKYNSGCYKCKRFPPTLFLYHNNNVESSYPDTESTETCGEWVINYRDNPKLKQQWEQFKTAFILQQKDLQK